MSSEQQMWYVACTEALEQELDQNSKNAIALRIEIEKTVHAMREWNLGKDEKMHFSIQ